MLRPTDIMALVWKYSNASLKQEVKRYGFWNKRKERAELGGGENFANKGTNSKEHKRDNRISSQIANNNNETLETLHGLQITTARH